MFFFGISLILYLLHPPVIDFVFNNLAGIGASENKWTIRSSYYLLRKEISMEGKDFLVIDRASPIKHTSEGSILAVKPRTHKCH